ncbi:MAG: hypothetical protein NC203_03690 [Firmicutes bacterium]|nr:hypothetical protein [[Eubacterium] siraeum]MCM1487449.1 hypothetical protein [Bacillota bacterium]
MSKFKKAMSLIAAAAVTIGVGSVSVSAAFDSCSYGTFEWNNSYCTVKNSTNTSRYMTAYFDVYEKNTGKYIDSSFSSGSGAYGTTVTANNPTSHSSLNSYRWVGAIYNSQSPNSGAAYTFDKP